jgi:hypothetical protein
MIVPENEINDLLKVFEEFDIIYYGEGAITQEIIDFSEEEYGIESAKELLGYKIKVYKNGSHKNDGQMVEYTFVFTSPKRIKSEFNTEMCLMVGWNIRRDIEIL